MASLAELESCEVMRDYAKGRTWRSCNAILYHSDDVLVARNRRENKCSYSCCSDFGGRIAAFRRRTGVILISYYLSNTASGNCSILHSHIRLVLVVARHTYMNAGVR